MVNREGRNPSIAALYRDMSLPVIPSDHDTVQGSPETAMSYEV